MIKIENCLLYYFSTWKYIILTDLEVTRKHIYKCNNTDDFVMFS